VTSLGCDPVRIDLRDEALTQKQLGAALQTYTREHILFGITFHGFGTSIGEGSPNGNIWEHYRIPILSLMADHPCYNIKRHSNPSPAIMQVYGTHDFLDFNTTYLQTPHRKAYVPWGTFSYGYEPRKKEPQAGNVPLIIFPKSGGNPFELEEKWKALPIIMQRVIYGALDDYWGQNETQSVVPSVLHSADASGVELRHDVPLLSFFVTQLDDFTRRVKSTAVIKSLLGSPVTLYADKIEHIDTRGARARLLPPVPYQELIAEYQKALAIVSITPNVDHCPHDRLFAAFGSGALPISDKNLWIEKECPDLLPYCYDFKQNGVARIVDKVMADPVTAAQIAWTISQQQRARRSFTQTVIEILELGLMHNYFTFNYVPLQLFYFKPGP